MPCGRCWGLTKIIRSLLNIAGKFALYAPEEEVSKAKDELNFITEQFSEGVTEGRFKVILQNPSSETIINCPAEDVAWWMGTLGDLGVYYERIDVVAGD